VYDMYPWSKHPAPADPGQAGRSAPTRATQATRPTRATEAVQVALDRRDHGGDAAAEPTASRARQ
jgi:hypothetical protein